MSSDLDSVPLQLLVLTIVILIHGIFVLFNTALGVSGHNKEKYAAANKLVSIAALMVGAWFANVNVYYFVGFILCMVIFGQYFPRKLAIQHADGIAESSLNFMEGISTVLRPITWTLMLVCNALLRLFRQKTDVSDGEFSEEEVMSMLEVGQETGVIKEEGKKMINSIFQFDDTLAYEIMTPRTDVFFIDIEDEPEEYMDELMTLRYSRIPVCKGDSDNIIGVFNIKDYLIKARENDLNAVDIEKILREPYCVPETKNIDSLLLEMQRTKQQIAILIDEYGGFSGIVTMEDIIEQVVGDIDDEYDEEEEIIDKIDEETYLVDGDVTLDDLDEELGLDLESESSETIGGFLIDILGEIPDEKDEGRTVEFEDYKFKIMAIQDKRIERVKIYLPSKDAKNEETV